MTSNTLYCTLYYALYYALYYTLYCSNCMTSKSRHFTDITQPTCTLYYTLYYSNGKCDGAAV